MPWPGVPDFNDGEVLGAAKLNQISDAIEFLHGLITGVNIPFLTVGGGSDFSQNYRIRHVGQYLHYKIVMSSGTHDVLQISYDGTVVYEDLGSQSAPFTWEGYVDLHDTGVITPTPTIGDFYSLSINFEYNANGDALVHYLLESNSTTL